MVIQQFIHVGVKLCLLLLILLLLLVGKQFLLDYNFTYSNFGRSFEWKDRFDRISSKCGSFKA